MDAKIDKTTKEKLIKERAEKTKAGAVIHKDHGDQESRDTQL